MSHNILFAGATGLIGSLVLPRLLPRLPADARVLAVGRRAPALSDPRVVPIIGALNHADLHARLDAALTAHPPSVFVCTLGSTMRQAGSESAFAALDRDAVVALAERARAHGARQAVVVSSVGADVNSASFYLRVKGEMQAAVIALGFSRVDFLQPGLLLGPRVNDRRPGERIAQVLAPLYNPLLGGRLHRYRAIPAATVAAALTALLDAPGSGITLHRNDALIELAAGG
ncbi:MAG: NAD-dependent dehydratase [Gammaproteobacteria bacterium HGW-Gammaproteobacteria-4]|jgi:uncharacterized protein YbjT (DUF2867 family)|nr:MAG: NAD-dependent dehydratase [Gammaproteobacteria bacterium HGW-Gammaproteobacteria-4]